jgi:hypothetical protein
MSQLNDAVPQVGRTSATATVPENMPLNVHPSDAETDLEVMKSVPTKHFMVEDEESASWVVRRIVAAREYGERVKQWAAQERRRAEREEQTLMYLFGRQVERWVQSEITRMNGKRKSLALPGGTVGFRTVAAKLVVDDEVMTLTWAREYCPQAIVVVETLSKTVFDQYVKETGHAPDEGVHIEAASEKFYIR